MWNLYTTHMDWTSYDTSTYNPKGGESIVPIDMCYRRAWTDQGVVFIESLNIIWEGIMRWRRCKLMRYFCQVLRWSLSVWRSVVTSRGVNELAGIMCG